MYERNFGEDKLVFLNIKSVFIVVSYVVLQNV